MSRSRECSTLHNNTIIVHVGAGEAQVNDSSRVCFYPRFRRCLIHGDIEGANCVRVKVKGRVVNL